MRIMQYCQHVLGIGHFFRSMEIARAFSGHEVLFVEGGTPLPGFTPPPHVRRAFLPPLMMDAEFQEMKTEGEDLEMVRQERRERLMSLFDEFRPRVLLIELFPFGRKRFRFELLPILKRIREEDLPTKVVCSLRDILVEKEDQAQYEARVIESLNGYFDLLLVHADPNVVRLEETFGRVDDIGIPVRYTGYVARKAPAGIPPGEHKTVVASSGGGKVGADLLLVTAQAVRLMERPDLRLRIFEGPFMDEANRHALELAAEGDPRIHVEPFTLDFLEELVNARVSVSMAGYNTCMDILSAGVNALVYPFPQNREQPMRARKLQEAGRLRLLPSLHPADLRKGLEEALEAPPPAPQRPINLSGARATAEMVEKTFALL